MCRDSSEIVCSHYSNGEKYKRKASNIRTVQVIWTMSVFVGCIYDFSCQETTINAMWIVWTLYIKYILKWNAKTCFLTKWLCCVIWSKVLYNGVTLQSKQVLELTKTYHEKLRSTRIDTNWLWKVPLFDETKKRPLMNCESKW